METGPADPKHSDVARGGATLPRDERLGSFADGEETRAHDERPQLRRPHDRHRCHILDLVRPTPGRILSGPAVTVSYFPSCSAALAPEQPNFANLFYEAVGDDPAGKAIMLASNGCTDPSMGGGTKLLRLHQNGCAAVRTMASCATSTSSRATTSEPTARVRRRAGEATT
jgi:hypothetical protein